MSTSVVRVAIVDDQALVREGIAGLLSLHPQIALAWSEENGSALLQRLTEAPVDLLLMDIRMPGENGIELTRKLRSAGNDTPILILTTFDDPQLFIDAMQAGASGFLLKDVTTAKLHQAVFTVAEGGSLAEPVLLNQLNAEQLSTFADGEIEPLSEREIAILKLIAAGYSNKEIADAVFLAEGTVKNHVSSLLAKLRTRDRTRAVLKAMSAGLI